MLRLAFTFVVLTTLVMLLLNLAMDGKIRIVFPPPQFSTDDIPSLAGKIAIVTGANTGLGYATSVELARKGCRVFVAARSLFKQKATAERIREFENLKVEYVEAGLDLGSFDSIRKFVAAFQKLGLPVNILINNAGIMTTPFALTKDGFESQFGVNHLGHFLLTQLLLPQIEKGAPDARIVNVASNGHYAAPSVGIDFENINKEAMYNRLTAYGQSKLANILHAKSLSKRLLSKGIYANAVHPGFVCTELQRSINKDLQTIFGSLVEPISNAFTQTFGLSPTEGSLTQLYLATSPDVEKRKISGRYYVPTAREANGPFAFSFMQSTLAQNDTLAEELWKFSLRATKT